MKFPLYFRSNCLLLIRGKHWLIIANSGKVKKVNSVTPFLPFSYRDLGKTKPQRGKQIQPLNIWPSLSGFTFSIFLQFNLVMTNLELDGQTEVVCIYL